MKSFLFVILLSSLSACSGSIFSEGSPTPPPAAPAPGPSADRPLVQDSNSSSSSSDGPGRIVGLVEKPSSDEPSSHRGRVITDARSLEIFEILAPSKVNEWSQRMNDRQLKDFLAKLNLNIKIDGVVKNGNKSVRVVNFYISDKGKNITNGSNAQGPWLSVPMEVNKDTIENDLRAVYLSGFIQSPDYPSQESPFVALSLKFKNGKNNQLYLYEGNFIEYLNGDPQPGFRINKNTNFRISIAL